MILTRDLAVKILIVIVCCTSFLFFLSGVIVLGLNIDSRDKSCVWCIFNGIFMTLTIPFLPKIYYKKELLCRCTLERYISLSLIIIGFICEYTSIIAMVGSFLVPHDRNEMYNCYDVFPGIKIYAEAACFGFSGILILCVIITCRARCADPDLRAFTRQSTQHLTQFKEAEEQNEQKYEQRNEQKYEQWQNQIKHTSDNDLITI